MAKITISAHEVRYNGRITPAFARVFADQPFENGDGQSVVSGSIDSGNYVVQVAVTFADGVVTIPSLTGSNRLDSTTFGVAGGNLSTYSLALYSAKGQRIGPPIFAGLRLPYTPTTTTWDDIYEYNTARFEPYRYSYYNTDQMDAILDGLDLAPLASDVIYGRVKLDTLPDSLLAPTAVGTNSTRINRILSVNYANSLATAITAIAATPTVLFITENTTLSTAVVVPSTLLLVFQNGAVITKSGSGAIEFQGMGVADPESQIPCFTSFASGNITWTGSNFPARLSCNLWSGTWSARLINATNSMIGKQCTLVAYPGTITAQMTLKEGHSLHMTRGEYNDTYVATSQTRFYLESNTKVYGDGMGQTIYNCSTATRNARIFTASGLSVVGLDGFNENIEVCGIYFNTTFATTPFDDGGAVINLGNCTNGQVHHCYFLNSCAYGAYFGGFPTAGFKALDCTVTHCIFDGVRGQNTGSINGENILVAHNQFVNIQIDAANGLIVPVDFEPNTDDDVIINIQVVDNLFDGRNAVQNWNAIVIQAGGNTAGCTNGIVADNIVIGSPNGRLINGILLSGCEDYLVEGNFVRLAVQSGLYTSNSSRLYTRNNTLRECGSGGVYSIQINSTTDSRFDGNIIEEVATGGSSTEMGWLETETSDTVNTSSSGNTVTRTAGSAIFLPFWEGKTVTITGVDYVVDVVTDTALLTLTTSPGIQTGATLTTKFSNNLYSDNTGVYTLVGTSKVISAKDRVVHPSHTPAQIAANTNNYFPSASAYRYNISTDASRNITGFTLSDFPVYVDKVDGERHEFYNEGSFNAVFVNQSASSTAANRFKTLTGGNITHSPGEIVTIEYDSTLDRWLLWKEPGVITAAELPTAIDAAKIAGGTVDNTEFGYLNGVTSAIQTQMDLKAPLISPSFTTPAIGAATGTSLAATGLIKSSSPTAGVGYATGAGGAVVQATSKVTAFTLSTATGQITFAADQLDAAETNGATWTNTAIAATDVVVFNHVSGGTIGAYDFNAQCGSGTATISITNRTAGNLSEAPVVQFCVIKGVTS